MVGLWAVPCGLLAASRSASHPGGHATHRYMSGHCVVAGHRWLYAPQELGTRLSWGAWSGRPDRAPGPGAPGLWGSGPYHTASRPLHTTYANHPGGRATHRYMSGHGVAAGRGRVYAPQGWEPMPGGVPGPGSPGLWGSGPYRMAFRPLHTTPTTLADVYT